MAREVLGADAARLDARRDEGRADAAVELELHAPDVGRAVRRVAQHHLVSSK